MNALPREHDKNEGSPPLKWCRKAWVTHQLDNMSSYEIWGGWQKMEELWLEVPGKEMCEERNEEIMKYATMEEVINIQGSKD